MKRLHAFAMAKMAKTVIAIASVGAMMLSVAACGAGSGASGKTTLTYLSWWGVDQINPLIKDFEKKNPNITVQVSAATGGGPSYNQALQTRVSGNQTPDVFMVPDALGAAVQNGVVRDLTNEPFMKNVSDWNKSVVTINGKVYGMSLGGWASFVLYNKDMFQKAGISKAPATWDEFLADCAKLKAAGITPYLENKDSLTEFVGPWAAELNGQGADAKIFTGQTTFSKLYNEPMQQYNKLFTDGYMPRSVAGLTYDQLQSQFVNGQVAMMCDGPWALQVYEKSKINFGIAPVPVLKSGDTPYTGGAPDPAFGISGKISGAQLTAAEKFLTFLSDPNGGLKDLVNAGITVPTVKNYVGKVDPKYQALYDTYLRKGQVYFSSTYWPTTVRAGLSTTWAAQTQLLASGQAGISGALSAMDKAAKAK